jgi:hypothetical protein
MLDEYKGSCHYVSSLTTVYFIAGWAEGALCAGVAPVFLVLGLKW